MLKLKIVDEFVSNRSGTSSRTGKEYSMNIQENCFVELNGEVRRCEINLEKGQKPYPAGNYLLDIEKSVSMGRFGFEIDRFKPLVIVPVPAAVSTRSA